MSAASTWRPARGSMTGLVDLAPVVRERVRGRRPERVGRAVVEVVEGAGLAVAVEHDRRLLDALRADAVGAHVAARAGDLDALVARVVARAEVRVDREA